MMTAINEFNRSGHVKIVGLKSPTFTQGRLDLYLFIKSVWQPTNRLRDTAPRCHETAEILADAALMQDFNTGVKELNSGQGISWDELKSELGL